MIVALFALVVLLLATAILLAIQHVQDQLDALRWKLNSVHYDLDQRIAQLEGDEGGGPDGDDGEPIPEATDSEPAVGAVLPFKRSA